MEQIYSLLKVDRPGTIRLIEIQPGQLQDAISLDMTSASLDDEQTTYEGLSYTWGDPKDPKTVYCNSVPFLVTQNLFSALQRLRYHKRPRTFWIDAICINQTDREERAQQVKQMLRIYKQATTVWLDLGPEVEHTEDMIELMFALVKAFKEQEGDSVPFHSERFAALGLPEVHAPAWQAWQELLSRPYFTRLWTIQEFAVSTHLFMLLGVRSLAWDSLYYLVQKMQIHGIAEDQRPMANATSELALLAIHGKNGLRNLHFVRDTFQESRALNMTYLLWLSRFVNASEAKDKVFGIIGLATDIDPEDPAFEINYSEKESVAQLFTRVAKGLIKTKRENLLDCLYEGGACMYPRVEGLPSWVPDWSKPRAGSPLGGLYSAQYHAADGLELSFDIDGHVFRVQGHIVDEIENLTSRFQPDTKGKHNDAYYGVAVAKWLREAFDVAQNSWPDVFSGHCEERERLWRTLICSKTHTDDPAPDSYREQFEALLVRQRFVDDALIGLENESQIMINDPRREYARASAKCRLYLQALQNTMFTKKFCITRQRKLMGMVPGDAEVGDVIALLAGSPVPFVLRRAHSVEKITKWELIQECYVHEVMDGTCAKAAKAEEWTELFLV